MQYMYVEAGTKLDKIQFHGYRLPLRIMLLPDAPWVRWLGPWLLVCALWSGALAGGS